MPALVIVERKFGQPDDEVPIVFAGPVLQPAHRGPDVLRPGGERLTHDGDVPVAAAIERAQVGQPPGDLGRRGWIGHQPDAEGLHTGLVPLSAVSTHSDRRLELRRVQGARPTDDPWQVASGNISGNLAADFQTNADAERDRRLQLAHLYRLTDDADIRYLLSFLLARAATHQQLCRSVAAELKEGTAGSESALSRGRRSRGRRGRPSRRRGRSRRSGRRLPCPVRGTA
ncbi:manganese catalase family protein [Kribbella sp. NPDC051718]|uniref:manganese catalase family protein n=1 Tax=Kribbella sp. NPDC051718 TaxID=3155168 RepID=UPI003429BA71